MHRNKTDGQKIKKEKQHRKKISKVEIHWKYDAMRPEGNMKTKEIEMERHRIEGDGLKAKKTIVESN